MLSECPDNRLKMGEKCTGHALANLLLHVSTLRSPLRRTIPGFHPTWEYHMIKKLLALAVLVGVGMTMAACETMEGVGQDTQHAGQSIERAADENK